MALKKPLVLGSDGRIQQLQSSDTLDGATESGDINQTAAETLIAGNVVYNSGANSVTKARANATGTSKVLGLAKAAISSSASGGIRTNGILTLTTAEWDALAGTSGGLTAGTTYYLSPTTAGLITSTAPTTASQLVVIIGVAISTTELNIRISEPILL